MLGYYSVLHELFFPKTKDEKRWKYHTPYAKMRRVFLGIALASLLDKFNCTLPTVFIKIIIYCSTKSM